jgi:hypothetical protein
MAFAVLGADPHPVAAIAAQLTSSATSQRHRILLDDRA